MSQPTVQFFDEIIRTYAPVETAEGFDNVGILLGKKDAAVTDVLVALDVTPEVVAEAQELGAQLIISHHPLFFHARKNLTEDDPEGQIACAMIRNHMALIAAHTNWDHTALSGSACMARLLGLQNIRQEDYLFIGELSQAQSAAELQKAVSDALDTDVRAYGNGKTLIRTVAVAGGAYDEGAPLALAAGAQALITGEVRHHNALWAAMSDFVLLDAGHYATEVILVPELVAYLQKCADDVQYKVRIQASKVKPFAV